ncbi:MAG: tetratricopeptide repeat protein [Burkholderiales bacterium]
METSSPPSAAASASAPEATPRKRGFRLPERALIVDEQPGARLALRDVVVEMGIRQVDTARDPLHALELIENDPYPLILSEVNFRGPVSGSQLLEVVRTRRLLPAHAAFVLVVSEASRSLVATTSEWQPDALLLKPIVHAVVAPRIEQAIRRRVAYAPVHEASTKGDPAELLATVDALIARLGAPSIELLKWRTQALFDLGKLDEAQRTAEAALGQRRPLPWAQVAIAQVRHAQGRNDEARELLETMIEADPYQGAAYDLLIKVHQASGRIEDAFAVARAAIKPLSTPKRLRTLGEMAYAQDELELAETCYTTLISKTGATPVRSALDVGMLGQVLVTQGQASKALDLVSGARAQWFEDAASQALAESVAAQAHGLRGDLEIAQTHARRAVELAGSSEAPVSVNLLVAQGALSAGLGDEAMALVRQTLGDDPASLIHTQPMAARVLRRAGFALPARMVPGDGDAVERRARTERRASEDRRGTGDGAQAQSGWDGEDRRASVERRSGSRRASYMQPAAGSDSALANGSLSVSGASSNGAGSGSSASAVNGAVGIKPMPALPVRPVPPGPLQVSQRLQLSDDALYQGHHAEAVQHAQAALAQSPDHPLALMAVVRSQLMRMQTEGYDEAAATVVQDCLRAAERLIPGGTGRMFKGLLIDLDPPDAA